VIYLLVDKLNLAFSEHFGFMRVLTYAEYRAILAILFGFGFVVLFARRTIRWLVMQKIGDNPMFDHADLDQLMRQKANTPTMGGLLISGAILLVTLLLADLQSFYIHMALVCLVWLTVVGGFDDWMKLTSARRSPGARQGLFTWEKFLCQLGLAVLLGLFIHHHGETKFLRFDLVEYQYFSEMSHALTLPLAKAWQFDPDAGRYIPSDMLIVLGPVAFVVLTVLVIAGSSNAVNLTDGMDGLASGVMVIVAFAFMLLALIAGYHNETNDFMLAKYLLVPFIHDGDELAIVAGAMAGSCLGFLWYNCSPAKVFMGDTGSLPLGGLIGYIAVVIRQEFLLLIIGGVFVMEAVSVMLQVAYFKATGGKRIFRCAPLHHHFHLGGWTEQQVVVRFWLITAILAALALATIRLR